MTDPLTAWGLEDGDDASLYDPVAPPRGTAAMSVQRVGRASARVQVETPLHEGGDWDAVIVGASFAGLAAAIELSAAGRVLLLDRAEVGEGETSACATPLGVLEHLQALEAVEQVHHEVVFHFPSGVSSGGVFSPILCGSHQPPRALPPGTRAGRRRSGPV